MCAPAAQRVLSVGTMRSAPAPTVRARASTPASSARGGAGRRWWGSSRAASRAPRNAAGLGGIACRSLVLDYAATGAAVGGTVERAQAGACTKEG